MHIEFEDMDGIVRTIPIDKLVLASNEDGCWGWEVGAEDEVCFPISEQTYNKIRNNLKITAV